MGRLGLDFETDAPEIDESAEPDESPAETAHRLAVLKAEHVHGRHPDAHVLGADQTVELDGERFRKPGGVESAVAQLHRLSGETHQLHCCVALAEPGGRTYVESVDFAMQMRELSEAQIREYVRLDEPLECAGAYKIERAGIRLFRSMRGDDYTAIIGLPLTRVWNILEAADYFSTPGSQD